MKKKEKKEKKGDATLFYHKPQFLWGFLILWQNMLDN
jgi:hypothetical protein